MRAITLPTFGDADALIFAEVPDAVAGPGEVLVEVVGTAVNRADVLQRKGFYHPPAGASPYPGLECSGRIVALGQGVDDWSVGDEVCALLSGGGYAELVAVPSGQLLPVPTGISLLEAASLPEVTCTVWSNVFQLAALQPGEFLLVHGGTSGIGSMALQLARRHGVRVVCTVGSADKAARAVELGAERAIRYRDEDFVEVVAELTEGRGADVVLDNMGGAYLARNVQALAIGGRLVVIGLQGGIKGELDLSALLSKRAAVHATSLRARPAAQKAAIVSAVRTHVWPALATGAIRPVIDQILPLERAADAHRALEISKHVGKILLQVR